LTNHFIKSPRLDFKDLPGGISSGDVHTGAAGLGVCTICCTICSGQVHVRENHEDTDDHGIEIVAPKTEHLNSDRQCIGEKKSWTCCCIWAIPCIAAMNGIADGGICWFVSERVGVR
jgi:hypothetical protein